MKRKSPTEILAKKRTALIERTARALAVSETDAAELLRIGRHQSIRINTLVTNPETLLPHLTALGWQGEKIEWSPDGYSLSAGQANIRDSELVSSGQVYIQNAASWLPPILLSPQPGERILDVCAAPGGKTTHIAALSHNKAHITANDNSRARLAKLQSVCAQMHAAIEQFTLFDARMLARKLEGRQFDKIMLDAPCSGEGMMQLDNDKDFSSWSVAQIKRLQQLQKQVIRQAWALLAPGGTLVYSTCTMAPEENEAVIDYALRSLEGVQIAPITIELPNRVSTVGEWNGKTFAADVSGAMRLIPSREVEAFFVCTLVKTKY